MTNNLYSFQQTGIDFLKKHPRALLGDEPGLGKTRQLIEAAVGNTLVVAPAAVLHAGVWNDEISKWNNPRASFTCVSYSYLPKRIGGKMGDVPRVEFDKVWDTVILDEVHNVKNVKAHSTKAVECLTKKAHRVYMATGTPILNYPQELFQIARFLDPDQAQPGKELGSKWRWIDTWFDTKPNRFNQQARDIIGLRGCDPTCRTRPVDDPCPHQVRFVKAVFKGKYLGRKRDDVLTQLPPLVLDVKHIPMTKTQDKAYKDMLNDYMVELKNGGNKIAFNFSSRHVNLSKITTGLGTLEDDPDFKNSSKMDTLKQDLIDRPGNVLVVTHYRSSAHAVVKLVESLKRRAFLITGGVDVRGREKAITGFKGDPSSVLVGTLDTISEGITLTQADTVIFVEQSYRPSRNEQAIRRIHRIGQTRPCTAIKYVALRENRKNTVDTIKEGILRNKTDAQVKTITCAQMLQMLQD